jgi:post-segregation antitoxin (ccd killing protein)
MKLVMTLLVRDEEDIVRANLDYHLDRGVDFVLVTDNGSVDATADLIEPYVRGGVAELLHEPEQDYAQARWVTRMARLAATEHAADWVINNDADEFWVPRTGDLRSTLAEVPPEFDVVMAQRTNFPPRPESPLPFHQRMTLRERRSFTVLNDPLPHKVCHRAHPDARVGPGNHSVDGPGLDRVLDDGRIEVLHYPLRSWSQFERKIVNGGSSYERSTEGGPNTGRTTRTLYRRWQEGTLREYYDEQVLDDAAAAAAVAAGDVLEDLRVRDVLDGLTTRGDRRARDRRRWPRWRRGNREGIATRGRHR